MAQMLKKTLGIEKGSAVPNRDKVAKITRAQAEKIAQDKMQDLNCTDLDAAVKIVLGTARSMGIELVK
jgi:large subunit ribosomal protein L11